MNFPSGEKTGASSQPASSDRLRTAFVVRSSAKMSRRPFRVPAKATVFPSREEASLPDGEEEELAPPLVAPEGRDPVAVRRVRQVRPRLRARREVLPHDVLVLRGPPRGEVLVELPVLHREEGDV